MDVGEFVDGKGWISDDSAFYGMSAAWPSKIATMAISH
jgi:hypothetical protein